MANQINEVSDWNHKIIEEFRANNGKVAAFVRQPLLLLTHKGAKTGKRRTNPLVYFRDGDHYVIVASKGGAPTNPDWYYNLIANPHATIEVGNEQIEVIAKQAEPVERERIVAMINDLNPTFKEYERKAGRIIPLMILLPALSDVKKSGNE